MNRRIFTALVLFVLAAFLGGCSRDPNVRKHKYVESGERYFAKGKYPEALIQFSNAIQVDANYADAHYQLGRVYLQMQQWTPAFQELTRSIELQPDNYAARLDLVGLLIAGHEFKQAKEQTDVLLEKQPNSPSVHAAVAELLAGQNDLPGAIQEMQKAIASDPTRWKSYLELGSLQMRSNQLDAAEPNFKKAVELNPKSTQTRLAMASYDQSRGRLPEAEREVDAAIDADPKDPEPRAAMVRLYMFQGKKQQAEQFLQQVKLDFPTNSTGYRMLGDFYFAIGDLEKATKEYAVLYGEHAGDLQVKENYVQLLILQNRIVEAEKLDDELLKTSPNDALALIYRGQIELLNGKPEVAIHTLQAALRSDPQNTAGYYRLGVAFSQTGDWPQAEGAWQKAVQLNPDLSDAHLALARSALRRNDMQALEQSANQLIRLLPGSPAGYAMRSLSLLKRNRFTSAEQDALKAISLAPKAPDGYMQMGNIRLAQKKYAEAAAFYEKTLDRDPGSSDALSSLMNIYVYQGDLQKAFSAAEAQIAKVPDSSAFYDLLGSARFDHRKTDKDLQAAESYLKKSAELDRHNADAWLKLSEAQAARGKVDEAIATGQSALQDNPKQIAFYILTGRLYESKHDFDKAQQCYQKALEVDPKSPQASNNLASLLTRTGGNLDVALSLAQTARRGLPDSPNVADTLGWVLYQKGAYKSAIDSLHEALDLAQKNKFPDSPTVHFHLGMAYEKDGQTAPARRQLEQVLKIDPGYAEADDIKKLLSQLRG